MAQFWGLRDIYGSTNPGSALSGEAVAVVTRHPTHSRRQENNELDPVKTDSVDHREYARIEMKVRVMVSDVDSRSMSPKFSPS